jgi:hypothetical protein
LDLHYDLGNPRKPRGHALLYFRNPNDGSLLATYLVTLPITMDMARYLPPAFAAGLPLPGNSPAGPMPIPPVPEPVESLAALERLAQVRDDDLLFCGDVPSAPATALMSATYEAAQRYGDAYQSYLQTVPAAPTAKAELNEEEVLYSVMSEGERISELAMLVGKLRYAAEGKDQRLVLETVRQMRALAATLPTKYRMDELLEAATRSDAVDATLLELLVDRVFKLYREEYEALPALELRIRELQAGR